MSSWILLKLESRGQWSFMVMEFHFRNNGSIVVQSTSNLYSGPALKRHDFYTLLFALSKINRHLKWARTKPLEVWGDINGHEEVVSRQLVNDSIKRIALGSTEAWERWHMVDWDYSNFNNNARCFICVYTIKLTHYDLLLLPCLNVMRGRSKVRLRSRKTEKMW